MKTACIGFATFLICAMTVLPGAARAAVADDAQRLADIGAELMAGNYEKAATQAKAFLGETKEKDSIVEARRILAECLRKQGNWRAATGAYTALSQACPAGSEDRLRYGAIGDVLKVTRDGVYGPAVATGEKRKLSDDKALDAALAMWAQFQCKKLKLVCSRLARARTPADVVKIVRPAAEEARGIFLVAPDTSPDEARRVAQVANTKLGQICKGVRSVLERKLHKYEPKMDDPWTFTNIEKRDIKQTHDLCSQMAAAEQAFQEALADLAGPGEWAEAESIRAACTDRQGTYRELSEEFVVPEYEVDIIW